MSHTCRGTISLHGALIHTVDACTFVVSNGGTQTFHIKAATEVERQQWVTALELAKAKAIQAMESGLYQRNIIHFLSGVHQRERRRDRDRINRRSLSIMYLQQLVKIFQHLSEKIVYDTFWNSANTVMKYYYHNYSGKIWNRSGNVYRSCKASIANINSINCRYTV